MEDLLPCVYVCASCGEENEILVDPGGGMRQSYTEDCEVCCRPNLLRIVIAEDGIVTADAGFEE